MYLISITPKKLRSSLCFAETVRFRLLLFSVAIGMTSTALAHDNVQHSHEFETDTRVTPRSADTHTTGTLPRAEAESLTAESKVRSEIRDGFRYVATNGIPNHVRQRGDRLLIGSQP